MDRIIQKLEIILITRCKFDCSRTCLFSTLKYVCPCKLRFQFPYSQIYSLAIINHCSNTLIVPIYCLPDLHHSIASFYLFRITFWSETYYPVNCPNPCKGSYYSLAVRRFQTILGVGLRIFPHFRGGLRLTNHGTVTVNRSFFARFSVLCIFMNELRC